MIATLVACFALGAGIAAAGIAAIVTAPDHRCIATRPQTEATSWVDRFMAGEQRGAVDVDVARENMAAACWSAE
jgi:hypothetical protein